MYAIVPSPFRCAKYLDKSSTLAEQVTTFHNNMNVNIADFGLNHKENHQYSLYTQEILSIASDQTSIASTNVKRVLLSPSPFPWKSVVVLRKLGRFYLPFRLFTIKLEATAKTFSTEPVNISPFSITTNPCDAMKLFRACFTPLPFSTKQFIRVSFDALMKT